MQPLCRWGWGLCIALVALSVGGVEPAHGEKPVVKVGLDSIPPWRDSQVVGSPEPPLPYRPRRAYSKLPLNQPIFVRAEPGTDRMLLVDHKGVWAGPGGILTFRDTPDADQVEPLLELDRLIYGFCFHPDYLRNGYLFVVSNGPVKEKNKKNFISRFTVDREKGSIDPASELIVIEWESNGHNGGECGFGPDGYLYIPTGDGTSDSDTNLTGQGLDDLLAVMIRIDVDHPDADRPYSIPPDNPFINEPGARPEIWAYGFRNPWRMCYDHRLNQLWVTQNGQDLFEQVYLVGKGENYGWSVYEGSAPFYLERKLGPQPYVKPTAEHPHSEARSLTGGVVYWGDRLAELKGAYLYGDFATGKIWGIKHDGTRVTWHRELADTPFHIVGFGLDHAGELLVVDHLAGIYYLDPTPPDLPQPKFPRRLSETGLFQSVAGHQVHPGLVPYSVNVQLWSDGAHKERFIALPEGGKIELTRNRGWNFTDNAVLVKSFALDTGPAAAPRRWIETRLMIKQQGEWIGYSYRWNNEQTDAELVAKEGLDVPFTIRDEGAEGGTRQQVWHFPSRAECMVCHSRAANYVLGLSEWQMNKQHDYGPVVASQLHTLLHLNLFQATFWDREQALFNRLKTRPGAWLNNQLRRWGVERHQLLTEERASEWVWNAAGLVTPLPSRWLASERRYANALTAAREKWRARVHRTPLLEQRIETNNNRLVDPYDQAQDLEARARSYLHANCAYCHVGAGGGNAAIEMEFFVDRAKAGLLDARPLHNTFGLAEPRIVAPGSPQRSVLVERMSRRGTGQMPPLATSLVDREAVELMRRWIEQLKVDPPAEAPPVDAKPAAGP